MLFELADTPHAGRAEAFTAITYADICSTVRNGAAVIPAGANYRLARGLGGAARI